MHNHFNLDTNKDIEKGIHLKEEGIDPYQLSKIIAGESDHFIANQLMHSDIDSDRMDYLMRDAYHTGVRLGVYDNNLLLKNLEFQELSQQT